MLDSGQKLDFIVEYIGAYEKKIKLANSAGLFDNAKLFELFAQCICKLWYGQHFKNLNEVKQNYPCVDLLSEDEKIFVQVSTQKNIQQKIRETLRGLNESKYDCLKNIDSPIFFVLSNESEENLGSFDEGKYHFDVETCYISTRKIIERAKNDLDFQEGLYLVLFRKNADIKELSEKLDAVVELSKEVYFKDISTKINNELECDRKTLIEIIKAEGNKVVVVKGDAGTGKTALCKRLLENEKIVLFVRAEKLCGCNSVNDIFAFSMEDVARYLGEKKAYLYIDALEYLADYNGNSSPFDLLRVLIHFCNKYPSLYLVISCRTCDMQIMTKLSVEKEIGIYDIPSVDDVFIQRVCEHYPNVRNLVGKLEYKGVLSNLFCLNEFVVNKFDVDNIRDVNEFRNYLFEKVICCSSNAANKVKVVKDAVMYIVLERAKNFDIGVSYDELDDEILKLLISNGVVCVFDCDNKKRVRLKYDIYEDICFEQIIDNEFDKCKEIYSEFFKMIESFGRCIYRRYQIWIENKLLARTNRKKFLHELLISNQIPEEWRNATETGIVKSQFCEDFFGEYGNVIVQNGLISEFLRIENRFAFEFENKGNDIFSLCPIGYGRAFLIKLILNNKLNWNDLRENDVLKLFYDYAKSNFKLTEVTVLVCDCLDTYVDEQIENSIKNDIFNLEDSTIQALLVLYAVPKEGFEWLKKFWHNMHDYYVNGDEKRARIAENILLWTIKNVNENLMNVCFAELCDIVELLWTQKRYVERRHIFDFYDDGHTMEFMYGLNSTMDSYGTNIYAEKYYSFLNLLIFKKPKEGLEWIIKFINNLVLTCKVKFHSTTI